MRALLPVEEIDACMHLFVCLCVCIFNIYIYILNLYICISLSVCPSVCLPSWLAVCLSAFAHLSLFCLCVCLICPSCLIRICLTHLSYVFYLSFIAISVLSIYILCLVSYLLYLSYCYLINIYPIHLSIYRSISVSTFCSIKSYSTLCILSIPPCHVYIRYLYISCVQFGWTESRGPAA